MITDSVVDRAAREQAAAALQLFLDGRISNFEVDAQYPTKTRDGAVHRLYVVLAPYLDDYRELRLKGATQSSPERQALLARCVLFLRTELPMEWPTFPSRMMLWARRLLGVPSAVEDGERSVWPFYRQSDYSRALGSSPTNTRP